MRHLSTVFLIAILFISCKKNTISNNDAQNNTPVISSFTPSSGGYNATVTIRGKNFGTPGTDKLVLFNGKSSSIQSWSDTTIIVSVPERAGTGDLEVSLSNTKMKAGIFTYVPVVYVTGAETGTGLSEAKYWKDGQAVVLGNGGSCNDIVINGTNIFAAGTLRDVSTGNTNAVIWKNGTVTVMPTGSLSFGSVLSIFLNGNELYAAGTAINNSTFGNLALSWKNSDAPAVYTDGSVNLVANSVFASGSDVWMAGYSWGSASRARLWKNGAVVSLAGADEGSAAFKVFVSGTDVYVAGYRTENAKQIAGYWKNSVFIPLSNGVSNTYATAITVSGTDVYVAGYEVAAGSVAKYWKNGVAVSVSSGNTFAAPQSIAFFDGNVYMAGYETLNSGRDVAVVWKNTNRTQLTDGTKNARGAAVAIQ